MSYHTIVLVGRLARDPELRYTPSGKAVATFTMAVDDGFGENKKTLWIRVTVWEKQAETVNNFLKKGKQVLVEGRLGSDDKGNPRVYTRQDGSTGSSFEVTASVVRFLGGREEGSGGGSSPSVAEDAGDLGGGGDIPF